MFLGEGPGLGQDLGFLGYGFKIYDRTIVVLIASNDITTSVVHFF
jgi:hypothetical protein